MRKSKQVMALAAAAAGIASISGTAQAASGTWTGGGDTAWSNTANWVSGSVPGSTSVTSNGDTVTFDSNPTNSVPVVDLNRNVKFITFDTANVGALTLGTTGGNALRLSSGAIIKNTTAVLNPIAVNAPLNLYGSCTLTGAATSTSNVMTIGGAITPATTSAVTLTLNGANTGDNTISGLISNGSSSALSLTKSTTAAGKWILSNTNNSFSGPVSLQGVLSVSKIGTIGNNSCLGQNGTITVGTGAGQATLLYTGSGEETDKVIAFGSTSTAGATIDQSGTGVLKFTANSTNAGTSKTITLTGSNTGSGWFAGNIVDGSGTKLAKTGSNTWTVSGLGNNYSGGTTISSGKLIAGSHDALGTTAGKVSISDNAILDLASDTGIAAYNIDVGSSSINVGRGSAGNAISYTLGALAIGNSSTLTIGVGSNITAGVPTLNFGTTTLGGSGNTVQTLSPVGVYVNLAAVTNNVTAVSGSGKTIVLDGTSTANSVTGAIDNGTSSAALNVVSVVKSNTSIWTLSGDNTYTGKTDVNGGTLRVNGTVTGGGAYTINAGGTLAGSGAITLATNTSFTVASGGTLAGTVSVAVSGTGNVTVSSGGKVAPGASAGNLQVSVAGTGTFNISGAVGGSNVGALAFELDTIAASDKITLNSGTLNIGSGVLAFDDFNFTNLGGLETGTYTLIDTSTAITGTLASTGLSGTIGTATATLSLGDSGRDVVLTVAVPEPASIGLAGMAAVGLLGHRRRRR